MITESSVSVIAIIPTLALFGCLPSIYFIPGTKPKGGRKKLRA